MDYSCNVEKQQAVSHKKLVISNAVPTSKDLQYSSTNARYVQKHIPSLLNHFLASGYENKQHTTYKNIQGSVINETHVENRLAVREAISQHRECNFVSRDSESKDEDITLASLLGYPKAKPNFENCNNGESQITATCSSRPVRAQQSLNGVEMNIDTEKAHLRFNDNCTRTHQKPYVRNAPSGRKIDSTSRLYGEDVVAVHDGKNLREGEGNDIRYENGRELVDIENAHWWMNHERVHMGDVHRAVTEFLSGNVGYSLETEKIKEEFVLNESENVNSNNLESSDILDCAFNFKAQVDSDNSMPVNESCIIQVDHRENVPIFVLSDDSNTLSDGNETCEPTTSVSTSLGHMMLDTPPADKNNGTMYSCNVCDKVFSKLDTIQNHVRMHLTIQPYACSRADCGKTFTSLDKLNSHCMRKGHVGSCDTTARPIVPYFRGGVTDVSVLNADAHTEPNNDKLEVFYCSKCNKEFNDSNSLLKHYLTSRTKIKSHPPECQLCGESFLTYYARSKHWQDINSRCYRLRSTGKKQRDIQRPAPVQIKSRVKQRKVSNFLEKKQYHCKGCDQKFNKERYLTDHVCFGTGADLYTCDTCSQTFVQKTYLIRHFRNCVA